KEFIFEISQAQKKPPDISGGVLKSDEIKEAYYGNAIGQTDIDSGCQKQRAGGIVGICAVYDEPCR
ncbi:hypothetical protein, partial [Neisseria gonorrhoeae]|uniref:hypothetical protein n=2 Tax=Neisseria gonorrhoeae TaxID=485 RepID=UPI001E57EBF3